MSSYCSVISVDTLDDSKFIKPSQKKKMLLGNNVVCVQYIGGSKSNFDGINQFFFAVHRLYYLHQWKLLLYLLNSQIKHCYFYLKASPALFSTDATDDVDVVKKFTQTRGLDRRPPSRYGFIVGGECFFKLRDLCFMVQTLHCTLYFYPPDRCYLKSCDVKK